jgi:hypothetical protein
MRFESVFLRSHSNFWPLMKFCQHILRYYVWMYRGKTSEWITSLRGKILTHCFLNMNRNSEQCKKIFDTFFRLREVFLLHFRCTDSHVDRQRSFSLLQYSYDRVGELVVTFPPPPTPNRDGIHSNLSSSRFILQGWKGKLPYETPSDVE